MSPRPAPEPASVFRFAFSGSEVQMLVGYVDPERLVNLPDHGEVEVPAEVTHRFMLSPRGLFQLKSQLDEIAQKLKDSVDAVMAQMAAEMDDTA